MSAAAGFCVVAGIIATERWYPVAMLHFFFAAAACAGVLVMGIKYDVEEGDQLMHIAIYASVGTVIALCLIALVWFKLHRPSSTSSASSTSSTTGGGGRFPMGHLYNRPGLGLGPLRN
jgi:hypothetical protein